jgi:NADPH:quinone reductase-like Zn-dependent oxidoreductase
MKSGLCGAAHMKAAVYNSYGSPDVLHIEDVEKPVPKDNEVLARVYAATVSPADWRFRKADPFFVRFMNGLWRPKKIHILGMEFAGKVESMGKAVTRFAGADEVVDYAREDFSRAGRVYDMVFDTVGKSGFSRSLKSLKQWASIMGSAKVIGGVARGVQGDQSFLKELIEAGRLAKHI